MKVDKTKYAWRCVTDGEDYWSSGVFKSKKAAIENALEEVNPDTVIVLHPTYLEVLDALEAIPDINTVLDYIEGHFFVESQMISQVSESWLIDGSLFFCEDSEEAEHDLKAAMKKWAKKHLKVKVDWLQSQKWLPLDNKETRVCEWKKPKPTAESISNFAELKEYAISLEKKLKE